MAEDTQRFSDGTAYEQFMGRWTRAIGTFFLDWLVPPTDPPWLDISCGTGVCTDLIVSTCSPVTVVAIDPSEPKIEIARKKPIAQRVDFRVCGLAEVAALGQSAAAIGALDSLYVGVPDHAHGD